MDAGCQERSKPCRTQHKFGICGPAPVARDCGADLLTITGCRLSFNLKRSGLPKRRDVKAYQEPSFSRQHGQSVFGHTRNLGVEVRIGSSFRLRRSYGELPGLISSNLEEVPEPLAVLSLALSRGVSSAAGWASSAFGGRGGSKWYRPVA